MSEYVTCYHPNITDLNSTRCVSAAVEADALTEDTTNVTIISSAEQYFRAGVLKEKTDISEGLGLPDPTLAGCLAVCWLLLYLTLRWGVSIKYLEANLCVNAKLIFRIILKRGRIHFLLQFLSEAKIIESDVHPLTSEKPF